MKLITGRTYAISACLVMACVLLVNGCTLDQPVAQAPIPTAGASPLPVLTHVATTYATGTPAQSTPTVTPTSSPSPTMYPSPDITATLLAIPAPIPTIDLTPPPAPALSIARTIRQFKSRAFIYTRPSRFLTLASSDGAQQSRLDLGICDDYNDSFAPSAEWSFSGRYVKIACQIGGDEDLNEFIIDTVSGKVRQFATPNDGSFMLWSPTNDQYLIIRGEQVRTGGAWSCHLSTVDARTGKQTPFARFARCPGMSWFAWSPDGRRIAFLQRQTDEDQPTLVVVNRDGSPLRRFALANQAPAIDGVNGLFWDPDGKMLMIEAVMHPSFMSYFSQALRVNSATGDVQIVQSDRAFRWSPDGKWYLAAQRNHWSLYKADGALVSVITPPTDRTDFEVAWMPDSQRFVIAAKRPERVEVIVADLSGQQTIIAGYPGAVIEGPPLVASPDGSLIALTMSGRQIVILDLQGHEHGRMVGTFQGWWPGK